MASKFTLVLKDGTIRGIGKKPRDKSKSKEAKEKRMEASQKGKTNVGNPRPKGNEKR